MKRWSRCTTLVVTILLVLMLSTMWTVPVLADDEAPPPTEAPEVVPPPEEGPVVDVPAAEPPAVNPVVEPPPVEPTVAAAPVEAVPTEAPVIEEIPTEAPVVEEVSTEAPVVSPAEEPESQAGAAVEEPAPSEQTPSEVLAQVPEGTDVVVTDASGATVSLATQAAADILVTGDPIWCPATVTVPTPSAGGCSANFGSMKEVIDYLTANPKNLAGIIWIAKDYKSSVNELGTTTSLTMNGDLMGTTANFALTLKGGWNVGTGTVDPNDPSEFNIPLSITNWNANVTLADLLITGVTGAGSTALTVEADNPGSITLKRVVVDNNAGSGAVLTNTDGGAGTGNVTLTSSRFTRNNNGHGLNVQSRGVITLVDVTASNNLVDGAYLSNSTIVGKDVSISLVSSTLEFNQNGQTGLEIYSGGNVTLADITALTNGADGAFIDNRAGTGTVTLTGINVFSENTSRGVAIASKGAISASNLIANANGLAGASLHNESAATSMSVTLSGTNEFKFNNYHGLEIVSKGGITLNNITANNNSLSGAYLENISSGAATPKGIVLNGYGSFHNNGGDGLTIYTYGGMILTDVNANNNGGYGAYLNNAGAGDFASAITPKPVTLALSAENPDTDFSGNTAGGLVIKSLGAINLSGMLANNSQTGFGAYLANNYAGAVGDITLGGWGGDFSNNATYGLQALSAGNITIGNIWAWGNRSGFGALLDNQYGTGAVTITGDSGYGNNASTGLSIASKGAVTLGNLYTDSNQGTGVLINNSYGGPSSPQTVTLTGTSNEFHRNTGNGLVIFSYGTIAAQYLYAESNGLMGVWLDNCATSDGSSCAAITANPITVLGNNTFERNGTYGLRVASKGAITVRNVQSRDNSGSGVYLDNQWTGATSDITVKNTADYWPEFARNGLDGLTVFSNGNVTIKDLDAYENGWQHDPLYGYGVYVDTVGNVSIGTSRTGWYNGLNNNFQSGLEVYTSGTVTLSNLRNNNNGLDDGLGNFYGYGAFIDNTASTTGAGVTLLGTNQFNDNASGGLYVVSNGVIKSDHIYDALGAVLIGSQVFADNNGQRASGGDGVNLVNTSAGTPQPVTLVGDNRYNNNYNNGIHIESKGAITLNNLTANNNGDGAELYNDYSGPTAPQGIVLTGFGDFNNNNNNGLDVRSYGNIKVTNVNASENGQRSGVNGFGALLDNCLVSGGVCTATSARNVTLNGDNNFWNNLDGGLSVYTLGTITLNNTSADENGQGIVLNNEFTGATGSVIINSGVFTSRNDTFGMDVRSRGAITITVDDAYVDRNGTFGWYLRNTFASTPQPVTLSSPNVDWAFDFSNNGSYGLWIQSMGDITSTGLDANNNGSFGATLDNSAPGSTGIVTITVPAAGNNSFNNNRGDGLNILSNRAITVGKLDASNNGWDCSVNPCVPTLVGGLPGSGVVLENDFVAGSSYPIIVTDSVNCNNNAGDGLSAYSYGKITIANLNASDNGQYNKANPGSIVVGYGYGADLDNSNAPTPKGIVLTGTNNFNNNYYDGLSAYALGPITINDLSASSNGGYGANLDNQWDGAVGGITLTTSSTLKWSVFNNNGNIGLGAYSHGAIAVSSLQANNNIAGGAELDAEGVSTPQMVTLTGRNQFQGNGDRSSHTAFGLSIRADGDITLKNVTALFNDGDGVYLNNCLDSGTGCTASGNITITGTNTFRGNYGDGLYFDAGNTMSLTKFTADGNGDDGIQGHGQNITLTCGSATRNANRGWWLDAWGSPHLATLQGVSAYGNITNFVLAGGTLVQTRTCPLP